MKKRSLKLAGILLSAVMLCGCAVNPGYEIKILINIEKKNVN